MTAAVRATSASIFDAGSPGISDAKSEPALELEKRLKDNSLTMGLSLSTLLSSIAVARNESSEDDWDGEGAKAVSSEAIQAAIQIAAHLPSYWKTPDVAAEPSGGIAFEWYRDRAHLVAVTTDGKSLRWVAADGPGITSGGSEPFRKLIPDFACQAIRKVSGR
jgi:hypothetical protein